MSSDIFIYGHNQDEIDWMRKNYQQADVRFQEIHPEFRSRDDEFVHGIQEGKLPYEKQLKDQYWWNLPCHWGSEDHFKQTENDIKAVLKELGSPKGLEVHLSPMVD